MTTWTTTLVALTAVVNFAAAAVTPVTAALKMSPSAPKMTEYTWEESTGKVYDESENYIDSFDTIDQARVFYPDIKE